MEEQRTHVLVVAFPSQGHINPALQFAKRLLDLGALVTFATAKGAQSRVAKTGAYHPNPHNHLTFAAFSDGYEGGFSHGGDPVQYMAQLKLHGSETLSQIISSNTKNPFTCVVYSILLPWVATVAREFQLPATLLWLQAAAVFEVYRSYFDGGCGDSIARTYSDPDFSLKLPGLPALRASDLPSFFNPANTYAHALPTMKEHFEILAGERDPKVLVNTCEELEFEALKPISGGSKYYRLVGVGPLIPDEKSDPSDSDAPSIQWLSSKEESSVIYVAFGSLSMMSRQQMEEMGKALLDLGHPFLWVNTSDDDGEQVSSSIMNEVKERGRMVPWSCQVEILSHPSVGCFITHCGWSSTLESLGCGVPVVAFPQWADQGTNTKLVVDVWKTGVRVKANGDGVVEAAEIKRCVEMVMGGDGEMRVNAEKWKALMGNCFHFQEECGTSYSNIKALVEEHSVVEYNSNK